MVHINSLIEKKHEISSDNEMISFYFNIAYT